MPQRGQVSVETGVAVVATVIAIVSAFGSPFVWKGALENRVANLESTSKDMNGKIDKILEIMIMKGK